MQRILRAVALVLAVFACSSSAFGQSDADRATARQLGQEGQEALDRKDFATAADRFKRADSLFHAPTLALGLARAQAGLGKVVASQETYNRIIREGAPPGAPPAFVHALEDAKKEVESVSARVAGVTITVSGPENPKVTLDDAPVPVAALGVKRPVDPGAHVIRATADGYRPVEAKITVSDGAVAAAALAMEREGAVASKPPVTVTQGTQQNPPPAQPTAQEPKNEPEGASAEASTSTPKRIPYRTIGYIALGVGGAGLLTGAITGILAIGKHSTLNDNCSGGTCPPDQKSTIDSYHTLGTVSTIGFIVGVVGAGAGAVLLLTAPKEQPATAWVSPYVGPGTVGAVGRF